MYIVLLSYKLTKICIIVSVGNTKVTITGTNLADIKEAKIGDVVCTKVDNYYSSHNRFIFSSSVLKIFWPI